MAASLIDYFIAPMIEGRETLALAYAERDSRYQLSSEPIDERWVGERPDGHGPGGKKAMICNQD